MQYVILRISGATDADPAEGDLPEASSPAPPGSWPAPKVYAEALSDLFPSWRIWADHGGWHARRRGGYLQSHQLGAPSFCVHADTAVGLAVQLCSQEYADEAHG